MPASSTGPSGRPVSRRTLALSAGFSALAGLVVGAASGTGLTLRREQQQVDHLTQRLATEENTAATNTTTGAQHERSAIEQHLSALASVTLADALTSARQTSAATHLIVEPLALATVSQGGDGLQAFAQAVTYAIGIVQAADPQSSNVATLQNLEGFLHQAHQLVGGLPIPLTSYAQSGVSGYLAPADAPTYLSELQQEITHGTL